MTEFPAILGLFQKRMDGDDALMRMAAHAFRKAGIGIEFYAQTPADIDYHMGFRPTGSCTAVAHLDRALDVLDPVPLLSLIRASDGRLYGLVLHDAKDIERMFDDYVSAIKAIAREMSHMPAAPWLFIEYAAMIDPAAFVELHRALAGVPHVSACMDTGHLGLYLARREFRRMGHEIRFSRIDPRTAPSEMLRDIRTAMARARTGVLDVISDLGAIGKPLHFHLHDAHPLARTNPFGLSDHLSFLSDVTVAEGIALPPMYGAGGLADLVRAACASTAAMRASLTIEIHDTLMESPLTGDEPALFAHWTGLASARRMKHWLDTLAEHAEAIARAIPKPL